MSRRSKSPAAERAAKKSGVNIRATVRARSASASAKPKAHGTSVRHALLAGCILLLLATLPYANSIRNGFVWDDHQQIVMNPDLRPGADLGHLFSAGVWGFLHRESRARNIYYRPLQMVTYRGVAAAAGVNPVAFHATSLAFAAASVLVGFGFFWKLTHRMDVAFAAAALFAVHPIHTEAVDWISALPDIGCTLFLLISFLLFLFTSRTTPSESKPALSSRTRWILWVMSLGSFAAALLWKETAAVFPLLVATYVFLIPEKQDTVDRARAAVMTSMPFWIVVAGYLLLRLRLLGAIATSQRNWQLSPLELALTVPNLMMVYWWKLVAPVRLTAYHVFSPATSIIDPRAIAGVLFLAVACVVIVSARRTPLVSFCILWVFITLLPVMDVYAVGRNVFAERYLYLPSVGFCLLVTILAFEALKWLPDRFRKLAGASALTVVVVVFASATLARNPDWKDDATLFARTLETSPNAPFVQNMVAAAESDHPSTLGSAEDHYSKAASYAAAEIPPDRVQLAIAYKGLAWIYGDRSDFNRALELLGQARAADPDDPEIDGEEGLILTKAGRWDEAAPYLQRAAAASGENENVLNALGIFAQQRSHQLDLAAAYFLRALAVHTAQDNFSASVHNNLGSVYGEQGRYSDAIEQFQAAIAIAPEDLEYHTNLATALAASGRYDDARAELRATLAINPNYEPARAVLRQLDSR